MLMGCRPPAVAGLFYPADPQDLAAEVRDLLAAEVLPHAGLWARRPRALIVPHAGFRYSGPVAASAYRALLPYASEISRVVLLGPAHRVYLRGMAVPSVAAFSTPLGQVPLDAVLLERVSRLPGVVVADHAHQLEHSLEVQLPFLQVVLGDYSLVPVVVGDCPSEWVVEMLRALCIGSGTLLVVSSDLSHYLPYETARAVDAKTSQAILACRSRLTPEEACGAYALNGLLRYAGSEHLQVSALDLRNSGDTAGDRAQVVGYGAYALC